MRSRYCLAFSLGLAAWVGLAGARGIAQPCFINAGDILIANYNGGSVVNIDPVSGAQERLGGTFTVPTDLVMDASGFLFISEWGTQQGGSRIKRFDLNTGAVTTLMDVGSGPSQVWGITQGPTGDLFITSRGNHGVYRVDSTTGVPTLLTQSNLLYTPIGIEMLDANHLVVACLLTNRLVSVSLADGSPTTLAEGGALDQPWGVAVSGGTVYAAAYDGKALVRVSGGAVTPVATLADFPYGLGIDPGGNPVIGLKGVAGSVVRVSPQGTLLNTYTGFLIGQVTGVEVARSSFPAPTDTDTDADGMADWQEAVAGTDPQNAASALRVSASAEPDEVIRLEWPGVAGRAYSVLRADDPAGAFLVRTNNLGATPPLNLFEDPGATYGRWFYRIEVRRLP